MLTPQIRELIGRFKNLSIFSKEMRSLPLQEILIFDTETTGFPTRWKTPPHYTEIYDTCRLIQLGVYSKYGEFQKEWLIKRNNFSITNFEIHGITNEMVDEHGQDLRNVLTEFMEILSEYKVIGGHNIEFDINTLASEMYRLGMKTEAEILINLPRIDTMLMATDVLYLGKWPKLVNLYNRLYFTNAVQTHTALDDCRLTWQCLEKLVEIYEDKPRLDGKLWRELYVKKIYSIN